MLKNPILSSTRLLQSVSALVDASRSTSLTLVLSLWLTLTALIQDQDQRQHVFVSAVYQIGDSYCTTPPCVLGVGQLSHYGKTDSNGIGNGIEMWSATRCSNFAHSDPEVQHCMLHYNVMDIFREAGHKPRTNATLPHTPQPPPFEQTRRSNQAHWDGSPDGHRELSWGVIMCHVQQDLCETIYQRKLMAGDPAKLAMHGNCQKAVRHMYKMMFEDPVDNITRHGIDWPGAQRCNNF